VKRTKDDTYYAEIDSRALELQTRRCLPCLPAKNSKFTILVPDDNSTTDKSKPL